MAQTTKNSMVQFYAARAHDGASCWEPAADVYRTPDGWLLKFDLAGVRREDLDVRIRGNRISVSGIRHDATAGEVCGWHSMEIHYNRFERTLELPLGGEAVDYRMEFADGLLLIRLRER